MQVTLEVNVFARPVKKEYHSPILGTKKTPMSEKLDHAYRKIVNAWCMYDWGSSAFSTTVESAVLPAYFEQVVGAGLPGNTATVYWGYTNAIALLISAILEWMDTCGLEVDLGGVAEIDLFRPAGRYRDKCVQEQERKNPTHRPILTENACFRKRNDRSLFVIHYSR